ncbi:MAG: nucleotidyltransferase substrate binding protein [Elusimicrobia bacterium]|nr:nucleotidyltransferase substrate binding protein [Elusimicrobiota bacterium]
MLDLNSLEKACKAFKLSLELYEKSALAPETDERVLLRDGVIQRFEFTFELSWKMIRRYLDIYGLEKADSLNNKDLFRVGHELGLIKAPENWFHYLKMRNQTSHIYDKEKAAEVFAAAQEFLPDCLYLLKKLKEKQNDRD